MKYLNKNYLVCIGSCLSQLANTILTDSNNPNISLSGEAYFYRNRSLLNKLWYKFINLLFFWQENHCKSAYYNDLKYAYDYIHRDEENKDKISEC